MFDPETVKTGVDAIKVFIDVVKSLKSLLPETEDRDRRLQNSVTGAIRTLYFAPDGVLSLLRAVAAGEELPEKRVQQALSNFNDREWRIREALGRIDFRLLHHEFGLSLAMVRSLQELRNGKSGLRRAVQDEVNFYGQDGVKPSKAAAKRLIAAIEKLNAQIEGIDGVVNKRAHSGKSPKKETKKRKSAKRPRKARERSSSR